MQQIGKYTLNEGSRFSVGVTSFGLNAGATVHIKQVDTFRRKVLVDFGDRLTDWFDDSILDKFSKIEPSSVYYCRKCGYVHGPDWIDEGETCPKCMLVQ